LIIVLLSLLLLYVEYEWLEVRIKPSTSRSEVWHLTHSTKVSPNRQKQTCPLSEVIEWCRIEPHCHLRFFIGQKDLLWLFFWNKVSKCPSSTFVMYSNHPRYQYWNRWNILQLKTATQEEQLYSNWSAESALHEPWPTETHAQSGHVPFIAGWTLVTVH